MNYTLECFKKDINNIRLTITPDFKVRLKFPMNFDDETIEKRIKIFIDKIVKKLSITGLPHTIRASFNTEHEFYYICLYSNNKTSYYFKEDDK